MIFEDHLGADQLEEILLSGRPIEPEAAVWERVEKSHRFLSSKLAEGGPPIYGVNTGFGSLCHVEIPEEKLRALQENLLITHAAGTGQYAPFRIVRRMLLLKIRALAMGYSGISPALLEMLITLYNGGWAPKVHEQGSLGASGDLAPLSELCLPILGLGMLEKEDGTVLSGFEWLQSARLQPHAFHPKEALALINGTQFMLSYGLELLAAARRIQQELPKLATLSLSAWQCRADPFFPHPHRIRPHAGQVQTAAEIYALFTHDGKHIPTGVAVQDPYSFRCIPQVHGASYDAIGFIASVLQTELNSVTDNPNVFAEEGLVLSAGNFHGQPLALALDFLALALSELGSISERRVYLLISGQRGLPPFLADDPGTDSGYMIAQYSAAALASQNKQLCTPASADSIVSSNGQEDHVSMGANAATKCLRVLENLKQLLGIEFAVASRAIALRADLHLHDDVLELLKLWEVPDHNRVPMESILRSAREHLFA